MLNLRTIIIFISLLMIVTPSTSFGKPVAVFSKLTHDFGIVEEGANLYYTYLISNEGDEELRILSAKPT